MRSVEQSCEKKKIEDALRSFGKYINSHVKINSATVPAAQNDDVKLMRAASLTRFNKNDNRNYFINSGKYFGDILASN